MDDLARFCCQNSRCPDFGRRDAGNLTVTGRLGKARQYRLLYCRSCRARFSERKGTPLYRAHLPEDKVTSILEHIREGCGVRKTARLVKVHPDTVSRYGHAAGRHSRAAHDELVAHTPETRELQMDEMWSFVAKKEKNCDEDDPEDRFRGDCWDHVAFDPEHRLVVSVVPGERTAESVQELVDDVKGRLGGRAPELITTDEHSAYERAILEAFGTEVVPPRTGRPGRPRKAYKVAPAGLNYATVHKTRKRGRVVEVATRVIFGTAASVQAALARSAVSRTVNTAFVERHHGTDRNRNARKARKTYCFSKDWWIHRAVTFFTRYSSNFCWPVRTLKTRAGQAQTPAMMAKLTDHVWTLVEWIKRPAVQFA
jgi:IS1 family transposase/transposase-like protein